MAPRKKIKKPAKKPPKAKRARSKPKPRKPLSQPPGDTDEHEDASQPLDNPRHERFCQLMTMHGMAAGPAYTLAGYGSTTDNARDAAASRLLREGKGVKSRFMHLQAKSAALAIDLGAITKQDVLRMVFEQHQRNIGVRPASVTVKIKAGPDRGKVYTEERLAYNEHAASQTLKLLGDEFGLGEAGSSNAGARDEAMGVRQGFNDPNVIEAIESVRRVRGMIVIQGSAKEVSQADALEALAKGKKA